MIRFQQNTMLYNLVIIWSLYLVLVTEATRHKFTTVSGSRHKYDARAFIGPIGEPFGFFQGGVFEMDVRKFGLQSSIKSLAIKNKKEKEGESDAIKDPTGDLMAGFALLKFENESAFAKFEEKLFETGNSYVLADGDVISNTAYDGKVSHPIVKSLCPLFDHRSVETLTIPPQSNAGNHDGEDNSSKTNSLIMKHEFKEIESGYYFLVYAVCFDDNKVNKSVKDLKLKSEFTLNIAMHNVDSKGRPIYLTAGDIPLPDMYLVFAIIYSVATYVWFRFLRKMQNDGGTVYQIHYLMTILGILKTLSLFAESARFHYIEINGSADMWTTVYYSFEFIKGGMLFTVILLLGSGWSMFKPFLNDREKKILFSILILQVLNNLAEIVILHHMTGEVLYNKWVGVLHLVDVLCCGAVLIPIVWQIGTLEEQSGESPGIEEDVEKLEVDTNPDENDPQRQRILSKLKLFRKFYIIVIVYIYFTRIVVYLFSSSLDYHQTWIRFLVLELATIIFYLYSGYTFRPINENAMYVELKQNLPVDNKPINNKIRKESEEEHYPKISNSISTTTRKQRGIESADI